MDYYVIAAGDLSDILSQDFWPWIGYNLSSHPSQDIIVNVCSEYRTAIRENCGTFLLELEDVSTVPMQIQKDSIAEHAIWVIVPLQNKTIITLECNLSTIMVAEKGPFLIRHFI